jgi:hypothetical protein
MRRLKMALCRRLADLPARHFFIGWRSMADRAPMKVYAFDPGAGRLVETKDDLVRYEELGAGTDWAKICGHRL